MVVTTRVKIAMIVTIQMKIAIFSVDRSTRRFTSVGWRRRDATSRDASPRKWSAPLRSHARVGCSIPAPVFFTALIHTAASGARLDERHLRLRLPSRPLLLLLVRLVHPLRHRADVLTTRARAATARRGGRVERGVSNHEPRDDPREEYRVVRHGDEHEYVPRRHLHGVQDECLRA